MGGATLLLVQSLDAWRQSSAVYQGKICIFLAEIDQPVLFNLDEGQLAGIKSMAINCKSLP